MSKIFIKNSDIISEKHLDIKIWKTQCTFTIFLLIFVVYLFYQFKYITSIPCDNSFFSILIRNFIHTNTFHLISNMAGLVILYKLENGCGFHKFLLVFLSLLFLNTIFEYVLYKYTDLSCSIGLSGIIFGFAVFELINATNCTLASICAVVAMITLPSIKNSEVSIIGHLTGVLSGIIIGIIFKKIYSDGF